MKNIKVYENFGDVSEAKGNVYTVKAQAFDRKTGAVVGESRDEDIDIATNQIFKGCKTILDIKEAYESFWNDLNPNSREIVFVQQITKK